MYVFDLEANGLLDEVTTIHCGVFICVKSGDTKIFTPDKMDEMIAFMDTQPRLIGHNVISYDFPALEKVLGYKYKGQVVDTLIMSRLLFPNRKHPHKMLLDYKAKKADGINVRLSGPHSVASWGYTLGKGKVDHEDWSTFSLEMLNRCLTDVEIQVQIFKTLRQRMTELDWPTESMNTTFKAFQILSKMEQHGWLVDKDLLDRSIRLLDHWINRIDRLVNKSLPLKCYCVETTKDGAVNWVRKPFVKSGHYAAITLRTYPEMEGRTAATGIVGGPFSRVGFRQVDINSRNELVEFLLESGWKPKEFNYKTDDNGNVIKDHKGEPIPSSPKLNFKDPFEGVDGVLGKLIVKRIQCRHRRSQMEGFRGLIRPDGRISQRITDIASTGRLQHGGIVNVPGARSFFGKRMRSIFIAPKGYKIVGTDSVSCQDRMLAARANDPAFTKMLLDGKKEEGTDGHSMNMHAINNKFKQHKLNYTVSRDLSKNLGYGLKFGASDKKLAVTANVPNQYGELIREALNEVSTAQALLVERLTKEWESTAQPIMGSWGRPQLANGRIKGLDGRPIFIELPHTILVYMLQSDEAILMMNAMVLLVDRLDRNGWVWGRDYAMVASVHDEYNWEVKEELAEQFAALSAKAIEVASQRLGCSVLAKGEAQIGDSWYDVH